MSAIQNWWNSLPYYITGAVIRFVRTSLLAGLTAGALLLTGAISPNEALISVQVAAGGALLAAVDKLRREWGIEREFAQADSTPVNEPIED
jgi:hypothetical protein